MNKDDNEAAEPFPIDDVGLNKSTRCLFCREFYDKAKPYICSACWNMIHQVVAAYPREFWADVHAAELEERREFLVLLGVLPPREPAHA